MNPSSIPSVTRQFESQPPHYRSATVPNNNVVYYYDTRQNPLINSSVDANSVPRATMPSSVPLNVISSPMRIYNSMTPSHALNQENVSQKFPNNAIPIQYYPSNLPMFTSINQRHQSGVPLIIPGIHYQQKVASEETSNDKKDLKTPTNSEIQRDKSPSIISYNNNNMVYKPYPSQAVYYPSSYYPVVNPNTIINTQQTPRNKSNENENIKSIKQENENKKLTSLNNSTTDYTDENNKKDQLFNSHNSIHSITTAPINSSINNHINNSINNQSLLSSQLSTQTNQLHTQMINQINSQMQSQFQNQIQTKLQNQYNNQTENHIQKQPLHASSSIMNTSELSVLDTPHVNNVFKTIPLATGQKLYTSIHNKNDDTLFNIKQEKIMDNTYKLIDKIVVKTPTTKDFVMETKKKNYDRSNSVTKNFMAPTVSSKNAAEAKKTKTPSKMNEYKSQPSPVVRSVTRSTSQPRNYSSISPYKSSNFDVSKIRTKSPIPSNYNTKNNISNKTHTPKTKDNKTPKQKLNLSDTAIKSPHILSYNHKQNSNLSTQDQPLNMQPNNSINVIDNSMLISNKNELVTSDIKKKSLSNENEIIMYNTKKFIEANPLWKAEIQEDIFQIPEAWDKEEEKKIKKKKKIIKTVQPSNWAQKYDQLMKKKRNSK